MTTGRSKPVPKDGASHSGSGSSSSLLGRRIIRKATLCRKLTYLKRAESPLSPKVSITTICDLCLLLRLPDRRGYFPLLCGSWLQFFCFSSFGTNSVDHRVGGTHECAICYKTANIVTECYHFYCNECLETHINKNTFHGTLLTRLIIH